MTHGKEKELTDLHQPPAQRQDRNRDPNRPKPRLPELMAVKRMSAPLQVVTKEFSGQKLTPGIAVTEISKAATKPEVKKEIKKSEGKVEENGRSLSSKAFRIVEPRPAIPVPAAAAIATTKELELAEKAGKKSADSAATTAKKEEKKAVPDAEIPVWTTRQKRIEGGGDKGRERGAAEGDRREGHRSRKKAQSGGGGRAHRETGNRYPAERGRANRLQAAGQGRLRLLRHRHRPGTLRPRDQL